MKAREYKYPNVVSFFLILSPLIYGIINAILFRINTNTGIDSATDIGPAAILSGMITENNMYFFGIICASFMVLFGNRNKYLYPMGVTAALVTTASTFFNSMCTSIALDKPILVLLSALRIIACIVMFISIVLTLHKNKNAEKVANISSVCYIVLVIMLALNFPGLIGSSVILTIIAALKTLMYINIPIAVHILVGHALATGQIKDGNLTLENK